MVGREIYLYRGQLSNRTDIGWCWTKDLSEASRHPGPNQGEAIVWCMSLPTKRFMKLMNRGLVKPVQAVDNFEDWALLRHQFDIDQKVIRSVTIIPVDVSLLEEARAKRRELLTTCGDIYLVYDLMADISQDFGRSLSAN